MYLLFQKEEADHCSLLSELENFSLVMLRRILHPGSVKLEVDMSFNSVFLTLDKVDFGHEFTSLSNNKIKANLISKEGLLNIQSRCHKFLIRACKELLARILGNIGALKKVKNLSPTVCLNHT